MLGLVVQLESECSIDIINCNGTDEKDVWIVEFEEKSSIWIAAAYNPSGAVVASTDKMQFSESRIANGTASHTSVFKNRINFGNLKQIFLNNTIAFA